MGPCIPAAGPSCNPTRRARPLRPHTNTHTNTLQCSLLEELSDDDFCMDDGHRLKPAEVHSYLCRVLYNRRNK